MSAPDLVRTIFVAGRFAPPLTPKRFLFFLLVYAAYLLLAYVVIRIALTS